jgi:hypothetical protein
VFFNFFHTRVISTLLIRWLSSGKPCLSRSRDFTASSSWHDVFRILDALHVALTIQAVYTYIVKGFNNLNGLEEVIWYVLSLVEILSPFPHVNRI